MHLQEEAEGTALSGRFTCCRNYLKALFDFPIFNGVAVFFSFYLFIYFHSEIEKEKALLLINEDFILLLHVTSFALLRFCIGSQELRSIIKSTPA